MKTYLPLIILILIICCFSNCSKDFSPVKQSFEWILPLQLNNEWEYQILEDTSHIKLKVEKLEGNAHYDYYKLNTGEFTFGYNNLFYQAGELFSLTDNGDKILLFKEPGTNSQGAFNGRVLFAEPREIEVPAGKFTCVKIMHQRRNGFITRTSTVWYAYGIGPVKKTEIYRYRTEPQVQKTIELRRFSIGLP